MTGAKAVILLLQASIFLTVFALGLNATLQDAASLLRRPGLLIRSLLAMNVIMPVFAVLVALAFALPPAVKAALVLLAVSPVPPILPRKQIKLGGSSAYVLGLLVTTSVLAILVVPFTVSVEGAIFHRHAGIAPGSVAKVVVTTVLLPLTLGMLARARAPEFARRASPILSRVAMAVLVLTALPLLVVEWRLMVELIGHGTLWSMAAFVLAGAATGYWLGGPDPADRSVLGLATASRHPGLAMAIAAANFPGQTRLITAAILLYLLVKAVVLIPYNAWCKKRVEEKELEQERRAA